MVFDTRFETFLLEIRVPKGIENRAKYKQKCYVNSNAILVAKNNGLDMFSGFKFVAILFKCGC